MRSNSAIDYGTSNVQLDPSPIRNEWLVEGAPCARAKVLAISNDDTSFAVVWDCTAGTFHWIYDYDEMLYVIEGSVFVTDSAGVSRRISAGDTVFFRAGSRALWKVDDYVRKIAFIRRPLPNWAQQAVQLARWLRGIFRQKSRLKERT